MPCRRLKGLLDGLRQPKHVWVKRPHLSDQFRPMECGPFDATRLRVPDMRLCHRLRCEPDDEPHCVYDFCR